MEKPEDLFDTWMQNQEEFADNWLMALRNWPQTFGGSDPLSQAFADVTGNELGSFPAWCSCVKNVPAEWVNLQQLGMDVLKDTLAKASGPSNLYTKLYAIWHPFFQALADRGSDLDSYRELLNPVHSLGAIDQALGFFPEAVAEIVKQTSRVTEAYCRVLEDYGETWTKTLRKNIMLSHEFVEGRPDSFLHVFHNLFTAFDNTVGKIYHVPAVGKDREKVYLILRGLDDLGVFIDKYTEFQIQIQTTGLRAIQKVIDALARRIRSGKEIKTFDEFLELWLDINEEEFSRFFRTEKFSVVQGGLLDAALNVRRQFHKLMELYLFDYPVALRSEMDDAYKTLYELKKRVRNLEQKLTQLNPEEAAA